MSHTERKTRSKRGSRTCGYGNAQKHRGAGHRGGRGMAGSAKHAWGKVSKEKPDHIGKKGFKRNPGLRKDVCTINVGAVCEKLDYWLSTGKVKETSGKIEIDLNSLGYDKLLGAGSITRPIQVKVDSSTQKASQKVEAAGGSIDLPNPEVNTDEA